MGKVFTELDDQLADFLRRQKVFFVATAPLAADGHVNVSPKGLDTLRVLGPCTVAYLDLVGSGVETVAHVKENGRVTVMACAFEGPPQIVRLHGTGEVVEPHAPRFAELLSLFPTLPGVRTIILVRCTRVSTSCGWGVPLMQSEGQRHELTDWATKQGNERLKDYQTRKNRVSIDGLPGLADGAEARREAGDD